MPQKKHITVQDKQKEYPRSYRLDSEIMSILEERLNRINEVSPKKITETRLIKALIWLSKDESDEVVLKALKEVW